LVIFIEAGDVGRIRDGTEEGLSWVRSREVDERHEVGPRGYAVMMISTPKLF